MPRNKGGVPSRNSDMSFYNSRDNIDVAHYAINRKTPVGLNYRESDFSYINFNDAIALYKYMMDDNCTQLDVALFLKFVLKKDELFSEKSFSEGWDHCIRIKSLNDDNIKLEYAGEYNDSLIISRLNEFLNKNKKAVRR